MVVRYYWSVFVLSILGLHYSSLAACPYDEISPSIVLCTFDDGPVSDTKGKARDETICALENSTWTLCKNGRWAAQSGGEQDLSRGLPLSRTKRGWFSDAVRFVRCLFGCSRTPKDTTPPNIICTPPAVQVTAEPFQTYAKATWPIPTATDNKDGTRSVRRVYGRAPGQHFPEGRHAVVYRANDRSGNSQTCTITVIVTVIKCPPPTHIANGYFQCFPSDEHVLGGWCKFGCYDGFELNNPTAAVLTCMSNHNWSGSQPTCKPLICEPPTQVVDAELDCTDNSNFRSICTYRCPRGFDMPPRVSKTIVCSINKRWRGYGAVSCVDIERPTIQECPSIVVAGTDVGSNSTEVSWSPPTVTDNSGSLTPKLEAGFPPGTRLSSGTYTITYTATDAGGNKANACIFNVNVRDVRCPRLYPTPSVQFVCPNGYRTGTVCDVKCDPGTTITGSDYVQCLQSTKGMYGEWLWNGGNQTTCISTRKCIAIPPPINGAIVCDNWHGGEFCQAQCRADTDMASVDLYRLYVCNQEGSWFPPPELKKCITVRRPHLHVGISASGYFPGDCTDPSVQETIKRNFVNIMSESLFRNEACPDSTECNPGNVVVACGGTERSKRETGRSKITIHITLEIDEDSVEKYDLIQQESLKLQNVSVNIADEVFKRSFGNINDTRFTYIKHGVSVECPEASVKSFNGLKCADDTSGKPTCLYYRWGQNNYGEKGRSWLCVFEWKSCFNTIECPEGSYYMKTTKSCEHCPKGMYQKKTAQHTCVACGYGKTTRTIGSTKLSDCEDACPPGSYSIDGLSPCSPCEVGHYQQLHGQMRCHECKGQRSTITVGSTSVSQCQEFDIDFIRGNQSIVTVQLPKPTHLAIFTLGLWIRISDNDNGTITINMEDQFGDEMWSSSLGHSLNESRVQNGINLPNSKWHSIVMKHQNCTTFTSIDGMPLLPEPNKCLPTISTIVMSSDGELSGSISQINVWDTFIQDLQLRRCRTEFQGNALKWKLFEDSNLDGNVVYNFPSKCDDFDNCISSPCIHGTCTDELRGYNCECAAGFTGSQCDINIDDCEASICMNNGTCIDNVMYYTCQCGQDYTGQFCEIKMVDGNWTKWGNWSECTTTCGPGEKRRTRSCTNPSPDNGGNNCDGLEFDVTDCNNTECPVCPVFKAPQNSEADCTNYTDTINCTVVCNEGFEFDIVPMPSYYCGSETFHEWNFQTDENPQGRLPKCMRKEMAESLSVSYEATYATLVCNDEIIETEVKSQAMIKLNNTINRIPCYHDGTCTVEEMNLNNCNHEARTKRSTTQAGFRITISTNPMKDNGTSTLPSIQDAITQLRKDASDGQFTLNVQGQTYELNLNATGLTGNLKCGIGMTQVSHFCIPCGKGAYLKEDTCEFCSEGTYQDSEGKTACVPCPKGRTTVGEGATTIAECTVSVYVETYFGLKVGAIAGGSVSGLVVVVFLVFVYRRYRASKKNLTEPTDITGAKPPHSTPPRKDVLGQQKSMFSVQALVTKE